MPDENEREDPDEDGERRRRLRRRDPDDDVDDRPRRRRDEPEFQPTEILIPTGVSAYSMAACYFGLFSCFIPLLGLLMALIALPCGIMALRSKKKATYGAITGDIRAVIGIVCSSLTLIGYVVVGILIMTKNLK